MRPLLIDVTLRVAGGYQGTTTLLVSGGDLDNLGVIELTQSNYLGNATVEVAGGTLINRAGGELRVLPGVSTPGGRTLAAELESDYGYRRVTELLRREGWRVNHKRVERLWRREGLKVPPKQPKRRRLWLHDGSCIRLRPARPGSNGGPGSRIPRRWRRG